jgi:hypothetical protein
VIGEGERKKGQAAMASSTSSHGPDGVFGRLAGAAFIADAKVQEVSFEMLLTGLPELGSPHSALPQPARPAG